MKAMVLRQTAPADTDPLKYEDVEIGRPGRGEIVMKVRSCGVCRSNLQVIEGERGTPPRLPLVPGHEVVGVVTEAGDGVDFLGEGDRVGAQPQFDACGRCELCISGKENLCASARRLGWSVDGGYAEYMTGFASHVHKIPDNLGDVEAAPLFCPGVTAYRAVKEAEPLPGKRIAIFGVGGVGHMAVQFARLSGAHVIAVSRKQVHTNLATSVGADEVIVSSEEDPAKKMSAALADSSIVFAPSDEVISQAIRSTKRGGVIVMGVDGNIQKYGFMRGQTIKGTVVGTRNDINEVLRIASKGLVKVKATEYKLNRANEALKELKGNRVEGRIVLTP